MATAQADVGFIAADLHLIATRHDIAVAVFAHDHRGFLAAKTDGFDLAHFIRKREERGRSREQLPMKSTRSP